MHAFKEPPFVLFGPGVSAGPAGQMYPVAILVLLSSLSCCAAAKATRIVRFIDDHGVTRTGHATPQDVARLSRGEEATVDVCCERGQSLGDATPTVTSLYGDRALTGARATARTLLAPIPKPPAIIGIGLNYRSHARQANLTVPEHPAVFYKRERARASASPSEPTRLVRDRARDRLNARAPTVLLSCRPTAQTGTPSTTRWRRS